jgi:hypothetical protein
MERETKTITTPKQNHEVVLKSYFTAGEKQKLVELKLKGLDYTLKILEMSIVSINGKEYSEKIFDEWHGHDFDFIIYEVLDIMKESSYKKKEEDSSKTSGE